MERPRAARPALQMKLLFVNIKIIISFVKNNFKNSFVNVRNITQKEMGFRPFFFNSGSLGGVIGSLLHIAALNLVLLDKCGQKVRQTLVGKIGERRAFFLNVLDALR